MSSRKVRNMRSRRIRNSRNSRKSRKSRKSIYRKKQKGGKYKSRKSMNLKTKSKKQKGGWKYDNEICEEWDQEKEVKNAFNKLSPEDRTSILGVEKEEWEKSLTHRRREERNKMKEHCTPKIDYCYFKHDDNGERTRFYDPNPPDAFIKYHEQDKKLYINPEDSVETSLMFYPTELTTDKLPNTHTCKKVRKVPKSKRFSDFFKRIWDKLPSFKSKSGYTQLNEAQQNISIQDNNNNNNNSDFDNNNSEFKNHIELLRSNNQIYRPLQQVTSRKGSRQGPFVTLTENNNLIQSSL